MNKNILKMSYPARWWKAMWREALPSGNGEIGAAVYGGTYEETVMLTHTDLWWKGKTPSMPNVSDQLPKVRDLLNIGEPRQARNIIADAFVEKKYNPQMASPLPLGDLKIIMPAEHAFKKYSRQLNMENGEVKVEWFDGGINYHRHVFVSRDDNIIVCKISSEGGVINKAKLFFDLHDRRDAMYQADNATIKVTKNLEEYLPQNLERKGKEDFLYYAATNDDGTDFGAVAKIFANHKKHINKELWVEDSQEILVLIKVFIKSERSEAWKNATEKLNIVSDSYEKLLQKHEDIHKKLFDSTKLDLYADNREMTNEALLMEAYNNQVPTALVEKIWAFGRYLLISSSKSGGNPCHLYGLWCGEYQGMWAFNMLNENVAMIYWHALSGNMPELLLALFDYYEKMIDDFKENAKKIYGCRGIYIPAPTTPESGLLKLILPHIIHWTGGAGWLAQHYYDYYLFTQDIEFLAKRALPFMKEVALFYEDFFVIDERGYFISSPSNSPENTPGNYWYGEGMNGSEKDMETTINATMDFAIAKEVLTNLINGSKEVNMYAENIKKWEEMLERIPPYEINEDGAVKEWMHAFFEDNYHHRHESHIYPVFPGIEVTKESDPSLFQAFVTAVRKRLIIGLKEQSGWSLAHMANNYARMGEGDMALECLEIMSRSCVLNNFYTTHNDWRNMGIGVDMDWAPIQLDANMGWCSAINEMLMFSIPGQISILPSLPNKWKKGKVENLLARGGIEVSIEWDYSSGKSIVELKAIKKDSLIDLIMPDKVISVKGHSLINHKIYKVQLIKEKKIQIEMNLKPIQQEEIC